jgi:hypothetical protein
VARTAVRVAALERRHRQPVAEPEIWIGFDGSDRWMGPDGEQRAEPPPGGRVIVLTWGEPESQQIAGGQG